MGLLPRRGADIFIPDMTARTGSLLRFLERHRFLRALSVAAAAAGLALLIWWPGWLDRPESASYDARVRAMAPGGRSDLIEVVDYDTASIEVYKQIWGPFASWPRFSHQMLVEYLNRSGARLVVFDLLFLDQADIGAEDKDFADECRRGGNVVLASVFFKSTLKKEVADGIYPRLPEELAERISLRPARESDPFAEWHYAEWPFEGLDSAARAVGSAHLEADPDQVTRRVSPAVKHAGRLWPTLSTAAAAAYRDEVPRLEPGTMRFAGQDFPLDADGRRLIYWYGAGKGRGGREPRYRITRAGSILDSVQYKKDFVDPERFRGKIVLVASSAAGSFDLRRTAMGHEPGVYIHAAAIESLIDGRFVRRISGGWTVLVCFLLASLVALVFLGGGRKAALVGTGGYLLLAGGHLGGVCLAYARGPVWADLVAPQAAAALALAGSLLAGFLVEGRQVRRFRRAFSRFLSPQVLAEVGRDLDSLRPGVGRRQELTIMFCDVRGFTPISEKLPPEEVVELLNEYLEAMGEAIMSGAGTLSKYLGDGIMAFWGAPQPSDDHAAAAARAALRMIEAQEEIKVRFAAAGRPVFDIGIGLHAGDAVVGTVGSEKRLDYTAIGDAVNLASRVEQLTKEFGVRIVVTADFAREAGDAFEFRALGPVKVKGRSAEVEVLELTGSA